MSKSSTQQLKDLGLLPAVWFTVQGQHAKW